MEAYDAMDYKALKADALDNAKVSADYQHTTGLLAKLRTIGFAIATFFFGTGLAMQFLPDYIVKYHYANGRTETRTETNAGNILVVGLKIGLIIVGAFIFAFVASVIMTIETALGLMHNFDWSGTKQVTSGSKAER